MEENHVFFQICQILKKAVGIADPEKQLYLDYDQLTVNDLLELFKKQQAGSRVMFTTGEAVLEGLRKRVSPKDKEHFFMIQSLLAGQCLVTAAVDQDGKVLASSIMILRAIQFENKLKRLLEEHQGLVVLKT